MGLFGETHISDDFGNGSYELISTQSLEAAEELQVLRHGESWIQYIALGARSRNKRSKKYYGYNAQRKQVAESKQAQSCFHVELTHHIPVIFRIDLRSRERQ